MSTPFAMLKVDEASSVRSSRVSTNNGHLDPPICATTSHPAVFLRRACARESCS